MKLLALPDPVGAVTLMANNGIFEPFLPELSKTAAERLKLLIEREGAFEQPRSLLARLLTLLPKDADKVDRVAARLGAIDSRGAT